MLYYKYRGYGLRTLELLLNRELYFSTVQGLNDPLDGQLDMHAFYQNLVKSLNPTVDEETNRKAFLVHLLNAHSFKRPGSEKSIGLNEALQEFMRQVGVLSLSKTAVDPLLWSHYAAGHSGVCLGFDVDKIRSDSVFIRDDIDYRSHPPYHALFLELAEELGQFVRPWENHRYDNKLGDEFYTRQISRLMHANLLVKSESWKYEKEYRLIRSTSGFEPFSPDSLQSIILGTRATDSTKRAIENVLRSPSYEHVRIQRAVHVEGSFEFGLEDI